MASGRLLLVAPDTDFRRSLVFALETEGSSVTVRDAPPARSWLESNRFDCTIVDQKALAGPDDESVAFCIKAHPVVLVTASPHRFLVEWVAAIVEMPMTGGAVSAAITHAMEADARHQPIP